jgi:hypothetical protein
VNIHAHITSSIPVVPTEEGFPTFAGTNWAHPIATSQSGQWLASGESSSAGATTTDDAAAAAAAANGTDTGVDGEDYRPKVRKQPGRGRGKRRGTVVFRESASASGTRGVVSGASAAQASEPDFFDEILLALGPSGPGESWGDSDVVW